MTGLVPITKTDSDQFLEKYKTEQTVLWIILSFWMQQEIKEFKDSVFLFLSAFTSCDFIHWKSKSMFMLLTKYCESFWF